MAKKNLDIMNNFPKNYNLYFDGKEIYKEQPAIDNQECDVFLRIMPAPASRIFSEKKFFELRKYVPKHSGLVFMFESGKVQAITGCFYFKNFIVKKKNELWDIVGEKATAKEKFDSYFEKKEFGVALEILDFQKFDSPVSKQDLYQLFPNFPKSPQPYVYLYSEKNSGFSNFLRTKATDIILRNNL